MTSVWSDMTNGNVGSFGVTDSLYSSTTRGIKFHAMPDCTESEGRREKESIFNGILWRGCVGHRLHYKRANESTSVYGRRAGIVHSWSWLHLWKPASPVSLISLCSTHSSPYTFAEQRGSRLTERMWEKVNFPNEVSHQTMAGSLSRYVRNQVYPIRESHSCSLQQNTISTDSTSGHFISTLNPEGMIA